MRARLLMRYFGILLAVVVISTAAGAKRQVQEPAKVALAPHADHRFHFSEGYDGHWLWLKSDGTYITIERGDTGIVVTEDRGRWIVDGSRLVLEAQLRARDIETPEFDILVQDLCGVDMLPELRRRIARIADDPKAVATVRDVTAIRDGGKRFRCGAIPIVNGKWGKPLLEDMLSKIDAYLAHPVDRQRFIFGAYAYHGRTFLIPVDPAPEKWRRRGLAEVVLEFGNVDDPELVYLDVPREFFEQVDTCDFPAAHGRCEDLSASMLEAFVRWFPGTRLH